jgi:hypothetical protein
MGGSYSHAGYRETVAMFRRNLDHADKSKADQSFIELATSSFPYLSDCEDWIVKRGGWTFVKTHPREGVTRYDFTRIKTL